MLIDKLEKKGLIRPPPFVVSNTMYLTIMGSHAYGVADTNLRDRIPDMDMYGFCIPPKDFLFPHLRAEIQGFGTPGPKFGQWQEHHVIDKDAHAGHGQEWDFSVFNIVKFFELCRDNNPNMVDTLFTPENCVVHCTQVGQMVRDSRRLFLSKKSWKRFRGYAHTQLHKADSKEFGEEFHKVCKFEAEHDIPSSMSLKYVELEIANRGSSKELQQLETKDLLQYRDMLQAGENASRRFQMRKEHGQDSKFLYHVIRLLDEAEQILLTNDLNLQRAKEPMKAIRRGEWKIDEVRAFFVEKEKALEAAYVSSTLPEEPNEKVLKDLLFRCLEEHYGNLGAVFQQPDWAMSTLKNVDQLLNDIRQKLYQS